jgi:hypothetical protein
MAPTAKSLLTRRGVLDRLGVLAVAAAGVAVSDAARATASGTAANACVDPAALSDADIQLRQSLGYADPSPEAHKACGGCEFFKADENGKCGHCIILSGPVSPTGHCSSWAAAAKADGAALPQPGRRFARG